MDADCLLRGRRGTFSTSGSICVAGVALSVPHRCPRKLGDDGGPMDADCLLRGRRVTFTTSGSICVAGVALSVPSQMSAEAWRRRWTHGRRLSSTPKC